MFDKFFYPPASIAEVEETESQDKYRAAVSYAISDYESKLVRIGVVLNLFAASGLMVTFSFGFYVSALLVLAAFTLPFFAIAALGNSTYKRVHKKYKSKTKWRPRDGAFYEGPSSQAYDRFYLERCLTDEGVSIYLSRFSVEEAAVPNLWGWNYDTKKDIKEKWCKREVYGTKRTFGPGQEDALCEHEAHLRELIDELTDKSIDAKADKQSKEEALADFQKAFPAKTEQLV